MEAETVIKTCRAGVIHAHIKEIGETMFTVIFLKKNGDERKMHGRRGVKKDLKGGVSTIKDHPDLIGMYEKETSYRCFDANRVLELRGAGMVTRVAGRDH